MKEARVLVERGTRRAVERGGKARDPRARAGRREKLRRGQITLGDAGLAVRGELHLRGIAAQRTRLRACAGGRAGGAATDGAQLPRPHDPATPRPTRSLPPRSAPLARSKTRRRKSRAWSSRFFSRSTCARRWRRIRSASSSRRGAARRRSRGTRSRRSCRRATPSAKPTSARWPPRVAAGGAERASARFRARNSGACCMPSAVIRGSGPGGRSRSIFGPARSGRGSPRQTAGRRRARVERRQRPADAVSRRVCPAGRATATTLTEIPRAAGGFARRGVDSCRTRTLPAFLEREWPALEKACDIALPPRFRFVESAGRRSRRGSTARSPGSRWNSRRATASARSPWAGKPTHRARRRFPIRTISSVSGGAISRRKSRRPSRSQARGLRAGAQRRPRLQPHDRAQRRALSRQHAAALAARMDGACRSAPGSDAARNRYRGAERLAARRLGRGLAESRSATHRGRKAGGARRGRGAALARDRPEPCAHRTGACCSCRRRRGREMQEVLADCEVEQEPGRCAWRAPSRRISPAR